MAGSIFLSHARSDKAFARKLFLDLESRGIKVWLDEAEIGPVDSTIAKIEKAIEEADYLGIVLSSKSVASEWVMRELEAALIEEIEGKRIQVIALLIEECKIPLLLRARPPIDFRDQSERSYERSLNLLLETLEGRRPALDRSNRLTFIKRLQKVPDNARWFWDEFTKDIALSLSKMLTDEQFDALHDLRVKLDRYSRDGIVRSAALEQIGGQTWEAAKTLEVLAQVGFLPLSHDPRERDEPDPGYYYSNLFWAYTNLMRFLAIGELKADKEESEYELSPSD